MPNPYFRFRQFTVRQEHTAMKVSTDACLFGAFIARELHALIPSGKPESRVLDIGSGTGLLSLMLAQQHEVSIEAVEMDKAAFEDCRANVEASPWSSRITLHHANILDVVPSHAFRIIISNPPFYARQLHAPDAKRNLARHETDLTLGQLLDYSARYLHIDGYLFLLLPAEREDDVQDEATRRAFCLKKKVLVRHSPAHPVTRIIWVWSLQHTETVVEQLSIREADGTYSAAFSGLLHDYYL